MNVLVVTQYFWPEAFRINELVRELQDRGHKVTVLTGLPNYPSGKVEPGYGTFKRTTQDFHGARVLRVPLIPRFSGRGWQLALNYLSYAFFASVFGPFRCRGRFDLIFVYEPSPITVGLPAIFLKWLKRIPIIFWVQDLWPESLSATGAVHSPMILNQVRKLVRFVYRHCDQILVQSRAFVPEIEKLGIPPEKIQYFPNSAEKLYRPIAVPLDAPERAKVPDGFRVVFAGNIGAAQDFETILKAATLLKSEKRVQWVIIGDGRQKQWVEEEVCKRGLTESIHLLGRYPVDRMPTFFSLADVLLVTLSRDPIFALTIPSKVQSYLACGKPIVAALDGEGARVIRESEAGIAVPSGSATELAKAVLEMLQMPAERREAMSAAALHYFRENFDESVLTDKLEENFSRQRTQFARSS